VTLSTADISILLPAFAAGLLVTATHVPLGMQVLARGIVFIDLAIAQIAGCGVLLADQMGFEAQGIAVQIAALAAALGGALLLTWTERVWPDVQEAVIGVVFILGATGSVLLLASNVHGSEHLRDLLVGQILWAQPSRLLWAALVYAAILVLWFGWRQRLGRTGFYVLFAIAVTISAPGCPAAPSSLRRMTMSARTSRSAQRSTGSNSVTSPGSASAACVSCNAEARSATCSM